MKESPVEWASAHFLKIWHVKHVCSAAMTKSHTGTNTQNKTKKNASETIKCLLGTHNNSKEEKKNERRTC